MRFLIDIAIGILVATAIGVGTAWYTVERGHQFGGVTVAEWKSWPQAGSPSADPYSLATLARTGEVPLGAGEGIAFTAEIDAAGNPLFGGCTYRIVGQTPAARLWTLTAYDMTGRLMINTARRSSYHSREVTRVPDGGFDIVVSSEVRSGNWLPISPVERFRLVLRLYDTPLTTGGGITDLVMPQIRRERCL